MDEEKYVDEEDNENELFENYNGDLVNWEDLDEDEQAYYDHVENCNFGLCACHDGIQAWIDGMRENDTDWEPSDDDDPHDLGKYF